MTPSIEVNQIVKEKLEYYKKKFGSKTYSDTINLCLTQLELLKKNVDLSEHVKTILEGRDFNGLFVNFLKQLRSLPKTELKKLLG